MRHYKYRHNNRVHKQLLKERINALNENQRHNHKMSTRLFYIGFAMYIFMFVSFFGLSIYFTSLYIENAIIEVFVSLLLILVSFILPGAILIPYFTYIGRKYPTDTLPRIIREMRIKSNQAYFNYYKIHNDYIITKIYDSSKDVLINKDVMIYFYNGKIRITNDFTTSSFDFGCYEFDFEEIDLSYDRTSDRLKTVLKTRDMNILLGKRAKPYLSNRITSFKNINGGDENEENR